MLKGSIGFLKDSMNFLEGSIDFIKDSIDFLKGSIDYPKNSSDSINETIMFNQKCRAVSINPIFSVFSMKTDKKLKQSE